MASFKAITQLTKRICMKFVTKSQEETLALASTLGGLLRKKDVIAFEGHLGAGKTCFTKGLGLGLGVEDEITSPTFTILYEYSGRLSLYHFDLYRLTSFDDFLDIAGDEYLDGDGVCVIEWSEKIAGHLPKKTIHISIEVLPNDERLITITNCPYQIEFPLRCLDAQNTD